MNKLYLFIFLGLATNLVVAMLPKESFASSFTIQQIPDFPNDGRQLYSGGGSANNCTKDLPIPDIAGAAYSSDGDTLNNTIWLREKFRDPSKFNNYANVTVYLIDLTNESQSRSLNSTHTLINGNKIEAQFVDTGIVNTSNSKNSTYYNYTSHDGSVMIMEDVPPKVYVITFDTTKELFKFYWPKVKKLFDSLANTTRELNVEGIQYKPDWSQRKERPSNAITMLVPTTPQWLSIRYSMTIQVIPSRYDKPTSDYIVSLLWNWEDNNWTRKVEQISVYKSSPLEEKIEQQEKLLSLNKIPTPDFSNTYGSGSHVDLSLKLKSIGSPETYVVVSSVYSSYLRPDGAGFCSIVDNTSWIPLPAPRVDISVFPNVFTLSPGETKPIQIKVNSSSNVPTKIIFNRTNETNESGLELNYSRPELSLPSNGKSSTTLYISVPNDFLRHHNFNKEPTLPIEGYVDFPSKFIDTSTSILYPSNQSEKIPSRAYAYIKILTEQDKFNQQLNDSFNMASSSMKELASFVVAIVAIVTPVGAWLGKRFVSKKVAVARDTIYYAAGVTTLIAGLLHIVISPILGLFDGSIAVFFLASGIFQLFLIVPIVKDWKKWYYFGAAGTIILIIIGMLSRVNESNVSVAIWILIEVLQVAYVIFSIIIILRKMRKLPTPFP